MEKQEDGNVINKDDNSFEEYTMRREAAKRQQQLFADVEFIKGEVISIKKILLEIQG